MIDIHNTRTIMYFVCDMKKLSRYKESLLCCNVPIGPLRFYGNEMTVKQTIKPYKENKIETLSVDLHVTEHLKCI